MFNASGRDEGRIIHLDSLFPLAIRFRATDHTFFETVILSLKNAHEFDSYNFVKLKFDGSERATLKDILNSIGHQRRTTHLSKDEILVRSHD